MRRLNGGGNLFAVGCCSCRGTRGSVAVLASWRCLVQCWTWASNPLTREDGLPGPFLPAGGVLPWDYPSHSTGIFVSPHSSFRFSISHFIESTGPRRRLLNRPNVFKSRLPCAAYFYIADFNTCPVEKSDFSDEKTPEESMYYGWIKIHHARNVNEFLLK